MAWIQQITVDEINKRHWSSVRSTSHAAAPVGHTESDFPCCCVTRYSSLRKKFGYLTDAGQDLLASLLTYDPEVRISAEEAGKHKYFE